MKAIHCTEYRAFVFKDRLVLRWIRSWTERGELEPKRPERIWVTCRQLNEFKRQLQARSHGR